MKVNFTLLAGQLVGMFLVFALCLFLSAGTLAWRAGWAFMVLFFGFVLAITFWLYRSNPGLLTERMTLTRTDQKTWDKILFALLYVAFFGWFILMPLDAVRFRWTELPVWLQVVGIIFLLVSFVLFFRIFHENSFLSPMVRIQEDRGQTVISTGPYHYVRHPMYAAALLFLIGTTLLLGSGIGFIAVLPLIGLMARRAVMEEHTLRDELQGYDAYMSQVRYRLIPYIW
ncbi:MAG TPA: isoprenylcysteine carboxylmethyltransferase family protein [Ktedonobacteraceae bacterium]|nr:isoprenylcysteine carboxylmethyltransferase family protein [Ktedonobacteraceae bacterium]